MAWELAQGPRASQTVRGEATWTTPAAGPSGTAAGTAVGPRRDGIRFHGRDETPGPTATPPELPRRARARGPRGKVVLPEGVRQAATDYVMETMRKRLER